MKHLLALSLLAFAPASSPVLIGEYANTQLVRYYDREFGVVCYVNVTMYKASPVLAPATCLEVEEKNIFHPAIGGK